MAEASTVTTLWCQRGKGPGTRSNPWAGAGALLPAGYSPGPLRSPPSKEKRYFHVRLSNTSSTVPFLWECASQEKHQQGQHLKSGERSLTLPGCSAGDVCVTLSHLIGKMSTAPKHLLKNRFGKAQRHHRNKADRTTRPPNTAECSRNIDLGSERLRLKS